MEKVIYFLRENKIEFIRGTSGGGNQLRQPYFKQKYTEQDLKKYPNTEHVHFFGLYIGNYPDLPQDKIINLCYELNKL